MEMVLTCTLPVKGGERPEGGAGTGSCVEQYRQ